MIVRAVLLVSLAAGGCGKAESESSPIGSGSAVRSAAPGSRAPPSQRASEIVKAEARRDSKSVSSNDLASRDPTLRRSAARTLARIADAYAAELLTKSLADEDPEVVIWSAYGLGYACRSREPATIRALVLRAASFPDLGRGHAPAKPGELVLPIEAIADALARCGTPDAERTLRAWLEGPEHRAIAAALALGKLAAKHGRIEDSSLALLLDAASRPDAPLSQALYAFTRLPGLGEPVRARLLEICRTTIASGKGRAFAIRALGQAGPAAATDLRTVLENASLPLNERADAARELGKLSEPGQVALRAALAVFAPKVLESNVALLRGDYGLVLRVLQSLAPPVREARELLERIAGLPIGPNDSGALRRRKVLLRCRAAGLLAGRATLSQRLRECDPEAGGRTGELAVLEVLDRGELTGARGQRFATLASGDDPIVREAALGLLGGHPEAARAFEILASALGAKPPGVVISAAKVLATYPDRAEEPSQREPEQTEDLARPTTRRPHPKLIAALMAALDGAEASPNVELQSSLMDAAAALQLLSVKPLLERYCKSPNSTLRAHAEASLRVLGDRERRCNDFVPSTASLQAAALEPLRVRLATELGELSIALAPELAPLAATRFVELARTGFYDGMVIHRVVPGFVVQFGDPAGDGYGGSGKALLPCETSPATFGPGSVGVALSGRDTGDSQLFVTLGDYPHLNGDYALLGHAQGDWDRLTEGDLIQKVTITP